MTSIEGRGRNVEEAIIDALAKSELRREEVDIKVIQEGKAGLLGIIGVEDSVVEIYPKYGKPINRIEDIAPVRDLVDNLIKLMGLDMSIDVFEKEGVAYVDIRGNDSSLLIGKYGDTLLAFEFLINSIMSRKVGSRVLIRVDVEGYIDRHEERLRKYTLESAEKAIQSRKEIELDPMSPRDRRVVHMAVKDMTDVSTYSVGEGYERRVVITPKK